MTEQELAQLKQQLKDEILSEIQSKPTKRMQTVWDSIKPMIERRFGHLNGPELYQLTAAVSTIIRYSLGIRQVRFIPYSIEDDVIRFVDGLLEAMTDLGEIKKQQSA
ncbi:hypothetical protein [Novibacillus thermophilus]|uniref:Uncharacterized protein n=1 Tax=Novibacillus thermophilus TaxID=1471761 RepID=A0A1U9K5F9_9BACL|nr:hypothetical protein [Novibacillus thermophilus]AQS55268.1 hypothetical protein B0W44_05220 [Novibacillus thermophilus]